MSEDPIESDAKESGGSGGKGRFSWTGAKSDIIAITALVWTALGVIWTVSIGYYQQVIVPSQAPVNLVIDTQLRELNTEAEGRPSSGEDLVALQLSVTARNVSTRKVHLLSNYWDAYAGSVSRVDNEIEQDLWLDKINETQKLQLEDGQPRHALPGRYFRISDLRRVGWGNIFPTTYVLHPGERVSTSVIFYVPRDQYEMIHVEVQVPTSERDDIAIMFEVEENGVFPKFYKGRAGDELIEVSSDRDIAELRKGTQVTQSLSQIAIASSQLEANAPSLSTQ